MHVKIQNQRQNYFFISTQEEKIIYTENQKGWKKVFGRLGQLIIVEKFFINNPKCIWPIWKTYSITLSLLHFHTKLLQGEEPKINEVRVNLIYVNELSKVIYNEIIKKRFRKIKSYLIPHTSSQ